MQININQTRYVCFNDKGEIEKISRRPDEDLKYIEVDFNRVRSLMEGKESFNSYKVEYDFLEKRYALKSTQEWDESKLITGFIYEIPEQDKETPEIKIIKDNKNKCWRIELEKEFKKSLELELIPIDPTVQYYSITKKHDPNILHRLLQFDQSYTVPFEYDFEFDDIPVSVYTVRKFSKYLFEVINE